MDTSLAGALETALAPDSQGILRMPVLARGEILEAPRIGIEELRSAARLAEQRAPGNADALLTFPAGDAVAIRQPLYDRSSLEPTGEHQFLLLPRFEPRTLLEDDRPRLARELYELPVDEVLSYIAALRETLQGALGLLRHAARLTSAGSAVDDRLAGLLFTLLPALLDPELVGEEIDRELGMDGIPGRLLLGGWVPAGARARRGATARLAGRIFAQPTADEAGFTPCLRALPTRQLHITAGNSPLVPFLSFLRALATKGAAVIKSPAEATATAAVLGLAMRAMAPDHPITRHTSLVYWRGGDPSVEDVFFAADAFDRLVVWGSSATVESVVRRARCPKLIVLRPRHGVSLIGREAFPGGVEEAARRGATDSLIANQRACSSSLVHYVEGSEAEALAYCEALRTVLRRWDEEIPHRLSPATHGRLRRLRRGELIEGTWLENRAAGSLTSAVVYMAGPLDLSQHPMSRLIVVRRVDDLRQALAFFDSSVATVGVYPEERRLELRSAIAAAGVSNVTPLGDAEAAFAGMPHDGMRVLSELVSWAVA